MDLAHSIATQQETEYIFQKLNFILTTFLSVDRVTTPLLDRLFTDMNRQLDSDPRILASLQGMSQLQAFGIKLSLLGRYEEAWAILQRFEDQLADKTFVVDEPLARRAAAAMDILDYHYNYEQPGTIIISMERSFPAVWAKISEHIIQPYGYPKKNHLLIKDIFFILVHDLGIPENAIDYDLRVKNGAHKVDIFLKNENIAFEVNGAFSYLHDPSSFTQSQPDRSGHGWIDLNGRFKQDYDKEEDMFLYQLMFSDLKIPLNVSKRSHHIDLFQGYGLNNIAQEHLRSQPFFRRYYLSPEEMPFQILKRKILRETLGIKVITIPFYLFRETMSIGRTTDYIRQMLRFKGMKI